MVISVLIVGMKHHILFFIALGLLTFFTPNTVWAEGKTPQFTLPIDCQLGEDCWTVNYVDTDPSDRTSDFTCGPRSYNDHKGTDFALRHLGDVSTGVNVLAAMDGTVMRLRDSEADTLKTPAELDAISKANKDCGNGILIDHASAGIQGLQTMYCHLKQGSISVKKGQTIKAGETIAQVGQSGVAEFPHVHFGVFWEGAVMDPFTGIDNTQGCGQLKVPLWAGDLSSVLAYDSGTIYDGGFSDHVPDFEGIKRGDYEGKYDTLPAQESKAFLLWAGFYGVRADDEIALKVLNSKGQAILNRNIIQEKDRARQFYYTGRKTETTKLEPGIYYGSITLKRGTEVLRTKTLSVTVE